jgi:hypothetical protein
MYVVAKTNAENSGNGQGNPLDKGILGRAVGIDFTARPAVSSRPNTESYESYGCSDSAPAGPAGDCNGLPPRLTDLQTDLSGEPAGHALAGHGGLQAGFEPGVLFVAPEIYDLLWVSSFLHRRLQSEMPGPNRFIPAHKIILKNLKG